MGANQATAMLNLRARTGERVEQFMWTAASDERVAESAVAGDRDAFGELVRRWENRIYRLAYGMLGSAEDARDATQETFFAAYRNLANFRGDARVSSWLHRIAINQCISRQRRAGVRAENPLSEKDETPVEDGLWVADSQRTSPARAAEHNERERAVRRAVASLPHELRQVVLLKEFEEMTFQQIADTLDLPLSTIKSRLYTALKQLRAKLARYEENATAAATGN